MWPFKKKRDVSTSGKTLLANVKMQSYAPRIVTGDLANDALIKRAEARIERLEWALNKSRRRGDQNRVKSIETSLAAYREQLALAKRGVT